MKMIKRLAHLAFLSLLIHAPQPWAESHTVQVQSHIPGSGLPDIEKIAHAVKASVSQRNIFPAPIRAMPIEQVKEAQARSLRAVPQTHFSADSVAPPVAGCYDVTIGLAYSAPTAASGFTDCFEFVAPDVTKLDGYVADLPPNEEHDVHLVQVNTDGTWTYLDNEIDLSPNKIVEAIPGGPVRVLLLVDSEQGAGGASFEFQVLGTTGYDSYEPNDSILHPYQVNGNQSLNGNLDSASDFDYYQFNVPAGETTLGVSLAGTPDQTLEVESSPGVWQSLAQNEYWTIGTSVGGSVMFRVYQLTPTASAKAEAPTSKTTTATAEPYSLNFSNGNNLAGFSTFSDTENLTHLVGVSDVARVATVGVKVYDSTGNIVQPGGIPVAIVAYDSIGTGGKVLLSQVQGVTDIHSGEFLTQLTIGPCAGNTTTGEFHTTSTPAQYWVITYASSHFEAYTAASESNPKTFNFTHICSETYRGNQP